MSDIIVIGGVKGKIVANIFEQMKAAQQNPGSVSASYSGTGRNIAENLGRLGDDTALIAAAGDDFVGKRAKDELDEIGVNTDFFQLIEGKSTAMNLAVLNIVGNLEFAVDNSDVYQCLTKKSIDKAADALNQAKLVCVDGTLSQEVLAYITKAVKVPVMFDPHTVEDAVKVRDFICEFDIIKPNRAEASAICGMEIFSEEQLMEAGQWFADQGVKQTFITMSGGGVYYKDAAKEGILRPEQVLAFANEEGAGDAFSAAILDGSLRGMDIERLAAYGMKAAAVALECKAAVNPSMSRERLEDA